MAYSHEIGVARGFLSSALQAIADASNEHEREIEDLKARLHAAEVERDAALSRLHELDAEQIRRDEITGTIPCVFEEK